MFYVFLKLLVIKKSWFKCQKFQFVERVVVENIKYMSKINVQVLFKIGKLLWLGGFIGCFKCDDYNKF